MESSEQESNAQAGHRRGTKHGSLLALGLGFVLAAALGLCAWQFWPQLSENAAQRGFVELDGPSESAPNAGNPLPRIPPESLVQRYPLTPERYAKLEPGPPQNPLLEWDPQTYYRYLPNLDAERPWGEHPEGRWTLRTNDQGWRENEPFQAPGGEPFVLVTGDSHADGICENHESFSNLAEKELRAEHPERDVKLWNTSKGGYTFYFYVGIIEKYLALEPDLIVVCVYGGNDFVGQMALFHAFEPEHPNPRRPKTYQRARGLGMRAGKNPMMQGFNQLAYFAAFPAEAEHALRTARESTLEMRRLCDAAGVKLALVYLPPLFDFGGEPYAKMREVLGLDPTDVAWTQHAAKRYLDFVRSEGIPLLDLSPELESRDEYCWTRDQHLNVAGHALVAERLAPFVAELLELE